jgi:hypothetical protein
VSRKKKKNYCCKPKTLKLYNIIIFSLILGFKATNMFSFYAPLLIAWVILKAPLSLGTLPLTTRKYKVQHKSKVNEEILHILYLIVEFPTLILCPTTILCPHKNFLAKSLAKTSILLGLHDWAH